MTDKQPEALRWADVLVLNVGSQLIHRKQAAAELRRLHEVNAELVDAFKQLMNDIDNGIIEVKTMQNANAALAKAEGK